MPAINPPLTYEYICVYVMYVMYIIYICYANVMQRDEARSKRNKPLLLRLSFSY